MNKRFLVGALLVALSTAGFAAGTDYAQDCTDANTNIGALNTEIFNTKNQFTALKNEINGKLDNTYTKEEADNKFATKDDVANGIQSSIDAANGIINQVEQDLNNKISEKADASNVYNKEEVDQKVTDTLQGALGYTDSAVTEVENKLNEKADKTEVENALAGKVDKSEFYDKYNELHLGQTFTDVTLKTHREQIEDLDKNKVDKNTYEEDKKAQAEKDNNQDQALKDETAAREEADKNLQGQINDFNNKFAGYDGRLSGLEKKVDHLDDKMNKGLSLMAAMNAVDFQNVQTGEMALGAGIGHYGNAQSVALGVAYAPVEDLTVNAKYSITAGDPDSFAVGAGATYKFKVGR